MSFENLILQYYFEIPHIYIYIYSHKAPGTAHKLRTRLATTAIHPPIGRGTLGKHAPLHRVRLRGRRHYALCVRYTKTRMVEGAMRFGFVGLLESFSDSLQKLHSGLDPG